MNRKVVVAGISSVAQAVRLLEAGAKTISCSVSDPAEERLLVRELVREVGAEHVGLMPRDLSWSAPMNQAASDSFDFVEVDVRQHSRAALVAFREEVSLPLRLAGLAQDYDEDPVWLLARIEELHPNDSTSFVVSCLYGLKQPFEWLRREAGKYPEDLVLADLLVLLSSGAVSIAADWACQTDLDWFLAVLPTHTSLSIYLGPSRDDGGFPARVSADVAMELCRMLARM